MIRAMKKKMIYTAPVVNIDHVHVEGYLLSDTGVNNSGRGGHSWTGKKHNWSDWDGDDDVENVGSSAGTGKSALELPSGGKLWDD